MTLPVRRSKASKASEVATHNVPSLDSIVEITRFEAIRGIVILTMRVAIEARSNGIEAHQTLVRGQPKESFTVFADLM